MYKDYFNDLLNLFTFEIVFILFIFIIIVYLHVIPLDLVYKEEDAGWLSREDWEQGRQVRRRHHRLPPVYPNGWFVIAESYQVKKEQVLEVSIFGMKLAVFRTEEGKVHVLDAYCPHLGANMAVGGKVRNGCLECPFHLWRFNGETGNCTYTNNKKVPKGTAVKRWVTLERNDFIMIWFHAEEKEPTWFPTAYDGVQTFSFVGRNQFLVNCHIQEIPENGSDVGHFSALHEASSFAGGDLRSHESIWLRWFRHEWASQWEPEMAPGERHIGNAILKHNLRLFGFWRVAFVSIQVKQMGPGLVGLSFTTSVGPILLLQSVTPVGPLLQRVVHRIYCPRYLTLYAKFILYAEGFMFKRDMMIWNHKVYLEKPILTKEDSGIARYRRWFTQFYTENSPTYESTQKIDLDW